MVSKLFIVSTFFNIDKEFVKKTPSLLWIFTINASLSQELVLRTPKKSDNILLILLNSYLGVHDSYTGSNGACLQPGCS